MALHMDKAALADYFGLMGVVFNDIDVRTKAVHGAGDFCVWECARSPGPHAAAHAADVRQAPTISRCWRTRPACRTGRGRGASCSAPA